MAKLLHEKFIDHPQYRRVQAVNLMTLSDYLELAAIQWACHYGGTLPIVDPDRQEDIKLELESFAEWLLGDVNPLRVIPGGRDG